MNNPDTRIAVLQGGQAEDFVRRNMPKAQLISLASTGLTAGMIEVVAGRADVGIKDSYTINEFVRKQPTTKNLFYDHPFNLTPVAWSVGRGNAELAAAINSGINILLYSGRYDDMAKPYFANDPVPNGYEEAPQYQVFPRGLTPAK